MLRLNKLEVRKLILQSYKKHAFIFSFSRKNKLSDLHLCISLIVWMKLF